MSKIELKLGRACLAWNNFEHDARKALYVSKESQFNERHHVLLEGVLRVRAHVKPDPDGAPMNGDEVEVSNNKSHWLINRVFIGKKGAGYLCENEYGVVDCYPYVRHPQPESKREQLNKLLETNVDTVNSNMVTRSSLKRLADQIDKIYSEVEE